jgi:hypothetical protein
MISKRLIHVNCLSDEAKTAVYTCYLALSLLASSLSGAAKLEIYPVRENACEASEKTNICKNGKIKAPNGWDTLTVSVIFAASLG